MKNRKNIFLVTGYLSNLQQTGFLWINAFNCVRKFGVSSFLGECMIFHYFLLTMTHLSDIFGCCFQLMKLSCVKLFTSEGQNIPFNICHIDIWTLSRHANIFSSCIMCVYIYKQVTFKYHTISWRKRIKLIGWGLYSLFVFFKKIPEGFLIDNAVSIFLLFTCLSKLHQLDQFIIFSTFRKISYYFPDQLIAWQISGKNIFSIISANTL